MLRGLLIAMLTAGAASPVLAQSPVYRDVDADGRVTYSDKPKPGGSPKVQNRGAPSLSAPAYDAAVNRAESERIYYERQRAEDRARRPVNVYDPRGSTSSAPQPGAAYPQGRRDYNLPDSPPPTSDRRYYYDGR